MKKCVRCGLCCFQGPCNHGDEKGEFGCSKLIINEDKTTSCELLIKGKVKPEDIGIKRGCILQTVVVEYYQENLQYLNQLKNVN